MIKPLAACLLAGAALSPTWASSVYLGALDPGSTSVGYNGVVTHGGDPIDYLYFNVSQSTGSLTFDYGPGQSMGIARLEWWQLWSNAGGEWTEFKRGSAPGSEPLTVTTEFGFDQSVQYKLRLGFAEPHCCSRDYSVKISGGAVTPVPETAPWAFAAAGFGALAWWSRRRRRGA